jgi:polysaccharide export outer membrane protein
LDTRPAVWLRPSGDRFRWDVDRTRAGSSRLATTPNVSQGAKLHLTRAQSTQNKGMRHLLGRSACIVAACSVLWAPAAARQSPTPQEPAKADGVSVPSAALPRDYVIGPEDLLSIVFWQEPAMSTEVVVRPDGKISLPLLKDVQAAGYTPEQLTDALMKAATKYVSRPNATVIVKQINSRKVFVIGQVAKPGTFPLMGDLTVLQAIALAGGVLEYSKSANVVIVRKEEGREQRFKFNYKDVLKGKNTAQNIVLKPGDTVIVP